MIKTIFGWIRAAFKAIGRVFGRVFSITVRKQNTEHRVMKKRMKEKMAQGETETFRIIEDEYLDRMKQLNELAVAESDAGDPTRRRILLSEEACTHFGVYKTGMDHYATILDKEGRDEAFKVLGPAIQGLVRYVHYVEAAMGQESTAPDMSRIYLAVA